MSAPQSKPKYHSLDAGRGIAALAVVWHHSTGMLQVEDLWSNDWYVRHFYGFALGVAYFFVLSGAVILLAHWDDLGHPEAAAVYLWKRAKRIYPIYWIALALYVLLYNHANPAAHVAAYSANFLLVRLWGPADPLVPVAWTLFHEVFFYFAFLAVVLFRRWGWLVLSAWWILAAAQTHGTAVNYDKTLSPLHLLFALGLLAAYLIRTRRVVAPTVCLVTGSVLLAAAIIWCGHLGIVTMQAFFLAGPAAFLMIIGAAELERRNKLRISPSLLFLGKASYAIYLFHLIAVVRLGRTLFRLNRYLPLPPVAWLILIFSGSVLFGCAAHLWIERPLMARLRGRSPLQVRDLSAPASV